MILATMMGMVKQAFLPEIGTLIIPQMDLILANNRWNSDKIYPLSFERPFRVSTRKFCLLKLDLNPDIVKHLFDLITARFDKTRASRHARLPPTRVLYVE